MSSSFFPFSDKLKIQSLALRFNQMLVMLKIGAPFLTSTQSLRNGGFSQSISLVEKLGHCGRGSPHRHLLRFSVDGGDDRMYGVSHTAGSGCFDRHTAHEGGIAKEEPRKSNGIRKKLKRYGLAGILSYGLLNTAYYLTTFLLVWVYFAPSPGRMGYLAAVERFFKVMAMVWAGSQVTKLVRAGGALALAPLVDRGLSWFTKRYKFHSQEQAFAMIIGLCFGMAIVVFLAVTFISA